MTVPLEQAMRACTVKLALLRSTRGRDTRLRLFGGRRRPVGIEAIDLDFPGAIGLFAPDGHILADGHRGGPVLLGSELERAVV